MDTRDIITITGLLKEEYRHNVFGLIELAKETIKRRSVMNSEEILVTCVDDYDEYAKGIGNINTVCQALKVDDLKRNMTVFLQNVSAIFDDVESSLTSIELKDISITVGISSTGKLSLIGSIETGIEGGITIRLKRNPKNV